MGLDPGVALYYLTFVPAIIIAITGHEFAHAWVAYRFGDTTARDEGRVSLNPLAHLDPVGTLGIIFVGFGWGKPVPVDPTRLRHPRADLLVSAAGPLTNLLLAALGAIPLRIGGVMEWLRQIGFGNAAAVLFPMFIQVNLMLAVFNFLPLGPLDGSHVLEQLLPLRQGLRFREFNRSYGYLLLMLLILSGYLLPVSILSMLLSPIIHFFQSLLLG
jgi:Zn-dependent protease